MVLWTMLTRVLGGQQLAVVVVVLADLVVLSLRVAAGALWEGSSIRDSGSSRGG
jgi:hypothetical protein